MTYDMLRFHNRMKYQPQPEIRDEKPKETENLDTNYSNSIENSNILTPETENSTMTYDMLREQNRMKYDKTYVPSNKSEETVRSRAFQKSPEIEEKFIKTKRSSNKYGDEIFE